MSQELNRENLIFMAELAETADRYDEMLDYILKAIKIGKYQDLSYKDMRGLLHTA